MATSASAETSTAPPPSSSTDLPAVKIGTRRSQLARNQTDIVCNKLKQAWPERKYEIHAKETMGDKNQVTALHQFNAKALWTHELEALLETGELDCIVHSLKDMPTQLPANLAIGCIFPREDPRDALVIKPTLASTHTTLASLPSGSVIGTSSVRRSAQLKRLYPHLRFADVRGNVGTRLAKLDDPDSSYSALILAAAGLIRLGLSRRVTQFLSSENGGILHAVGQGAIGVEVREGDEEARKLFARVGCERTTRACLAERSLMRTLEGGCSVPIGVETDWLSKKRALGSNVGSGVGVGLKPASECDQLSGVAKEDGKEEAEEDFTDELIMKAIVVSLEGDQHVEVEARRRVNSREDADEFGWEVAQKLVEKGAEKILHEINLNRKIIQEQGDA